MAVRKQFWNKKASIGLTATDPFANYLNQKSTTSGVNFSQTSIREIPFRSFGITLSYRFGKLEFKKERSKDDNNNDMPGNDNGGNNGNSGGGNGGGTNSNNNSGGSAANGTKGGTK